MFIIHLILLAIFGYNPVQYVRKVMPTLVFAFTSRSSVATIPLNVETQTKRLGVPDGIANLSALLWIDDRAEWLCRDLSSNAGRHGDRPDGRN